MAMKDPEEKEYLLGISNEELERLRFQHGVWKSVTENFLDRLNVGRGWNCLDVGAGPGFVSIDLRQRVEEEGAVTALEPSKFYTDWFEGHVRHKRWKNVAVINASVESADLPGRTYDLIFARWVIAFVPDPAKFLAKLLPALKPNGIIALQDYYYEGLSLYPRGGAFDGMSDVVRAHYRSGGGDAYVTGTLPTLFRKHGVKTIDFSPHSLAGGPGSAIMEWGHRFFTAHAQHMIDKKLMTQEEGDAMMADWFAHRNNPDSLFFSPIVVDVAGVAELEG
jgi:SAM-dependent methyltransferase